MNGPARNKGVLCSSTTQRAELPRGRSGKKGPRRTWAGDRPDVQSHLGVVQKATACWPRAEHKARRCRRVPRMRFSAGPGGEDRTRARPPLCGLPGHRRPGAPTQAVPSSPRPSAWPRGCRCPSRSACPRSLGSGWTRSGVTASRVRAGACPPAPTSPRAPGKQISTQDRDPRPREVRGPAQAHTPAGEGRCLEFLEFSPRGTLEANLSAPSQEPLTPELRPLCPAAPAWC